MLCLVAHVLYKLPGEVVGLRVACTLQDSVVKTEFDET